MLVLDHCKEKEWASYSFRAQITEDCYTIFFFLKTLTQQQLNLSWVWHETESAYATTTHPHKLYGNNISAVTDPFLTTL